MSRAADWIDSTEALSGWLHAMGPGPLALDTEADSFHHYRDKVCLVQLSAAGLNGLVDPLARCDLSPLAAPLGDRDRLKILHGADYDLRILDRDHGLSVKGLFDTMIAARLAGETAVGLSALLERHLRIRLDKTHQKADWSRRPLPPELKAYAVEDTRHLEALAAILRERLAELGRTGWAEEEFVRLESIQWRNEEVDPEAYRGVKGSAGLDRRGLACLRELHAWREGRAREKDVPPFRIARSEVLLSLAARRPTCVEDLHAIDGLPASMARGASGVAVLEAIARGLAVSEGALPELRHRVRIRRDPDRESRAAGLRQRRDRIADGLGLDPSVLASRALIDAIVDALDREEDPSRIPELRRWQWDQIRSVV